MTAYSHYIGRSRSPRSKMHILDGEGHLLCKPSEDGVVEVEEEPDYRNGIHYVTRNNRPLRKKSEVDCSKCLTKYVPEMRENAV